MLTLLLRRTAGLALPVAAILFCVLVLWNLWNVPSGRGVEWVGGVGMWWCEDDVRRIGWGVAWHTSRLGCESWGRV